MRTGEKEDTILADGTSELIQFCIQFPVPNLRETCRVRPQQAAGSIVLCQQKKRLAKCGQAKCGLLTLVKSRKFCRNATLTGKSQHVRPCVQLERNGLENANRELASRWSRENGAAGEFSSLVNANVVRIPKQSSVASLMTFERLLAVHACRAAPSLIGTSSARWPTESRCVPTRLGKRRLAPIDAERNGPFAPTRKLCDSPNSA